MWLWGFNFFWKGFFILSSYTNDGVCEREKASSFAIFGLCVGYVRIANVLAFLRWLDTTFATFVLWDLSVVAKL